MEGVVAYFCKVSTLLTLQLSPHNVNECICNDYYSHLLYVLFLGATSNVKILLIIWYKSPELVSLYTLDIGL